jgi:hypothetical protein
LGCDPTAFFKNRPMKIQIDELESSQSKVPAMMPPIRIRFAVAVKQVMPLSTAKNP